MIIETQTTPDENVLNFFPPSPILKSGRAEFVDAKSLRKSPLAEHIFDIGNIVSIFITSELISITKTSSATWDTLKPQIMAEIMDHLSTGESTIVNPPETDTDIINQIQGLLNARIRPAVKQDGGDIAFVDFQDGIVYVEMQGSCKGCPYAMVTLKEGVEKILKTYIPEVKEVRNISADGE
ncbi:MAG: NifU family protein [Alphaproteobacteria bacterium]|nr:NifU family protein [Alphaproteobacteria bacterium]